MDSLGSISSLATTGVIGATVASAVIVLLTMTIIIRERKREIGVIKAIGGPWAIRYSLSHLVKDETHLDEADWQRTARILPHGALAAGFLTGRFDVVSVSAAASTGMMDLRSGQWCRDMLDALEKPERGSKKKAKG